jgi:hypothetical protein
MITVSLDYSSKRSAALDFLKKQQASTTNYINSSKDPYQLIEAVSNGWQGAIPYTVILDADGKIIYQNNGVIDPLAVKRRLVEKLGRHYQ